MAEELIVLFSKNMKLSMFEGLRIKLAHFATVWWQATLGYFTFWKYVFCSYIWTEKKILAFLAQIMSMFLIAVTLKYNIEWGHIFNSHFSSIFTNDTALDHLLCLQNDGFCRWCSCNGSWQNCVLSDVTRKHLSLSTFPSECCVSFFVFFCFFLIFY